LGPKETLGINGTRQGKKWKGVREGVGKGSEVGVRQRKGGRRRRGKTKGNKDSGVRGESKMSGLTKSKRVP